MLGAEGVELKHEDPMPAAGKTLELTVQVSGTEPEATVMVVIRWVAYQKYEKKVVYAGDDREFAIEEEEPGSIG